MRGLPFIPLLSMAGPENPKGIKSAVQMVSSGMMNISGQTVPNACI